MATLSPKRLRVAERVGPHVRAGRLDVGRRAAAPRVRPVHDVVVHEREEVHELERRAERDAARRGRRARLARGPARPPSPSGT